MKHQWLAYVIVGLLSIGAGVAIAGLPDNAPVAATIGASTTTASATTASTTEATEPTVVDTTIPPTSTTAPATTLPDTSGPGTTEPESTVPESTVPDTTDSMPVGLPDRSELNVASANGAGVDGAASRIATQLEEIGYVDVVPLNGTEIVEFTTIYFAEGFDESALRLAGDLDLLDVFVAPIENSPAVADLPADIELVAYIGLDRA